MKNNIVFYERLVSAPRVLGTACERTFFAGGSRKYRHDNVFQVIQVSVFAGSSRLNVAATGNNAQQQHATTQQQRQTATTARNHAATVGNSTPAL